MEIDDLVRESVNTSISDIDLPMYKYDDIFEKVNIRIEKREGNVLIRILTVLKRFFISMHLRDFLEAAAVILVVVAIPILLKVGIGTEYIGPSSDNIPDIIIERGNRQKISENEAVNLINEYRKSINKSSVAQGSVVELKNSEEIFNELGCQVFKDNDFETYIIRDKKVTPIGTGFGGYGVASIFTADLNKDGRLELVYTYSWGSGLHRSHIAVLMLHETNKEIVSEFVYLNKDLLLEKRDYYTILVREYNSFSSESDVLAGEEIGTLSLEENGDVYKLKVNLRNDLPEDIERNIWKEAGAQ